MADGERPPRRARTPSRFPRDASVAAIVAAGLCWLIYLLAYEPLHWHPDEWAKVQQVIEGKRKFFHPDLMLTVTSLFSHATGIDDTLGVLRLGRFGSALAASGAAVLFARLAAQGFGLPGFAASVLICASNPSFLIAGRYFKEDSYLLLSVAALLTAFGLLVARNDKLWVWLAFGIAGGLVCSAKYVGILFFAVAVLALIWARSRGLFARDGESSHPPVLISALAFIAALIAINYRALYEPRVFLEGFAFEARHIATGHYGAAWPWSSPIYLDLLLQLNGWPEILIAAVALVWFAQGEDRRGAIVLAAAAFGVVYGIGLVWSPVKIGRYIYPISALLSFIAAAGVAPLLRSGVPRAAVAGVLTLAIVTSHASAMAEIVRTSANDTRIQLSRWLKENTRPDDLVVAEWYAGLTALKLDGNPVHQADHRLGGAGLFLSDYCRQHDCAAAKFVVTTCFTFGSYLRDDVAVYSSGKTIRQFYQHLLKNNPVVSFGSRTNDFLQRYGSYDAPCILVFTGEQARAAAAAASGP